MRQRFLLLAADQPVDQAVAEDIQRRAKLSRSLRARGLLLLTNDVEQVIALPDGTGFIIGQLFHRHGYPEEIKSLPFDEQAKIAATGGKHLTERYWGSYVAALFSKSEINVVRDPSGGMPCYHGRYGSLKAFTSDATTLVDVGFVRPSVDVEAVEHILFRHQLPTERTAIAGISQILAGCGLVLGADSVRGRNLWSQWDHIDG